MAATDKKNELRRRAMTAAATLLGLVPAAQAGKFTAPNSDQQPNLDLTPSNDRWTWDSSFLQYNENDRIAVSEPQVGVRRDFDDARAMTILATVDVISGSTPLGTLPATANASAATVTSASGRASNPGIGSVPTSHMADTRLGLNGSYERPVGTDSKEIVGAEVGKEHDFLSLGANYTLNRDFNEKNTTLSLGVSPEYDFVRPNGGLPFAYGTYQAPGEFQGTQKSKYLMGGLLGLTQVINQRTLMQFNYSPTYENGYLNDPYKLVSVTDANGNPLYAVHENRPGSRLEHSFYWLTRYNYTSQDVFSLGLRYFTDNWGIRSETLDFGYRRQYHPRRFVEPHVRYYHQSAADFYRVGLVQGQVFPNFASADYRLNSIDGVTFGLRMGWTMLNGSELILRAEYYAQTGESHPDSAIGIQRTYDLFPTLGATIFQIEYRFEPSKIWTKT